MRLAPQIVANRLTRTLVLCGFALVLSACAGNQARWGGADGDPTAATSDEAPTEAHSTPTQSENNTQVAQSSGGSSGDAPEISRSNGVEGGVLVFWPRIIPSSEADNTAGIARQLQSALVDIVEEALPGRSIDVRPEPERVCGRAGCDAMSVGILLARNGDGCSAIALISGDGTAPAQLVEWVGLVNLQAPSVPFRDPPEAVVQIRDHARCTDMLSQVGNNRDALISAIQAAAR